jgi:hypothetical protein
MLLALASVVFLTIFYWLGFETSLFVASYDSQGYVGDIRTPLHTGVTNYFHQNSPGYNISAQTTWKTTFLCCCTIVTFVSGYENVFTEPLPRSGFGIFAYLAVVG